MPRVIEQPEFDLGVTDGFPEPVDRRLELGQIRIELPVHPKAGFGQQRSHGGGVIVGIDQGCRGVS